MTHEPDDDTVTHSILITRVEVDSCPDHPTAPPELPQLTAGVCSICRRGLVTRVIGTPTDKPSP